MGMTSHPSDAYDAFSYYCVYSSFILSLMKMSLMSSMTIMVLGPGSFPFCAYRRFLNYPYIMLVDCNLMHSPNPFVAFVEYFPFPPQKNYSFKFRIPNMIMVCCRFAHSFRIMRIPQPSISEVVPPHPVHALRSGRGGEFEAAYIRCINGREPRDFELLDFTGDGICEVHPYARVQISNNFVGRLFTPLFSINEKSEFLSWVADL